MPQVPVQAIWRARRPLRRSNYERRIFYRLLALAAVPLVFAGMLAGVYAIRQQTRRSNQLLLSTQENTRIQIDMVFDDLRSYYIAALRDDTFLWLQTRAYAPYSSYSNLKRAQELLRGGSTLYQYVSNYAYINVRNSWALTNHGMYSFSNLKNKDDVAAFVEQIEQSEEDVQWINALKTPAPSIGSRTINLSGYLLVLRISSVKDGTTGILLVQLDFSAMQSSAESWKKSGYEIIVKDAGQGTVLFGTDSELAAGLEAHTGSEIYTRGSWRLCAGPLSTLSGVTLYTAVSSHDAFAVGGAILLISILTTVGVALVLIICRYNSILIYSPVQELMEATEQVLGQRSGDEDEFAFMASGVNHLAANQAALQHMVEMQHQHMCEQFLQRILRSEISQPLLEQSLLEMDIRTYPLYRLLAVGIQTGDANEAQKEAIALAAAMQLPSAVTTQLFVRPVTMGAVIVLVVGAQSAQELEATVREVCRQTVYCVKNIFGYECRIGASLVFSELPHMHNAYFEARETLRSHTKPFADSEPFAAYVEPSQTHAEEGYSLMLQTEIVTAVTLCNKKEAKRLLELFAAGMDAKGIGGYERRFYVYRMTAAILAVAENVGLSVDTLLAEREGDMFERILRLYEAEQIQRFLLREVAVPVMDLLTSYRQDSSSELTKKVMALIQKTGGDITLEECAAELNYHPSYIWKVLNSEQGKNFTDLVNAEKMRLAKDLLLTTDMTVAQIAEKLHYSNVQNFIRFFSREAGVTPGKYRKDHQMQQPQKLPSGRRSKKQLS